MRGAPAGVRRRMVKREIASDWVFCRGQRGAATRRKGKRDGHVLQGSHGSQASSECQCSQKQR